MLNNTGWNDRDGNRAVGTKMMKRSGTTIRLTLAALGTVALFGAAAAAGVDRGTEMMASGVTQEHVQTSNAPADDFADVKFSAHID